MEKKIIRYRKFITTTQLSPPIGLKKEKNYKQLEERKGSF